MTGSCPLCSEPVQERTSDGLVVRATCRPCGGHFSIAQEALLYWLEKVVPEKIHALALGRARNHIAARNSSHRHATITIYDVWIWSRGLD
jgi:hypothetical protein